MTEQGTLPLGGAIPAAAPEPLRVKNGTYTIRNRGTGDHRTFRVRTQKPDAKFAPGMRVLALLTGPNNESDFTGIAFVESDRVRVWRKKEGTQFEVLARMFWAVAVNEDMKILCPQGIAIGKWQDRYELMCEARCVRCNRKLTEPESIETGIGPECGGRR